MLYFCPVVDEVSHGENYSTKFLLEIQDTKEVHLLSLARAKWTKPSSGLWG